MNVQCPVWTACIRILLCSRTGAFSSYREQQILTLTLSSGTVCPPLNFFLEVMIMTDIQIFLDIVTSVWLDLVNTIWSNL